MGLTGPLVFDYITAKANNVALRSFKYLHDDVSNTIIHRNIGCG